MQQMYKVSSDKTTAVSTEVEFQDINTCPRGLAAWFLTKYGKGIEGIYTGQPDFIGWYPKPKIPQHLKEKCK
jgi:hypothetical protein